MIYCVNCGFKNDDDANFCNSCGTKLVKTEPKPVVETPVVTPVEEPVVESASKTRNIYEIDNLFDYFSQKQASYDRYEQLLNKFYYFLNKTCKTFLVLGIIFTGLILLFSTAVIAESNKSDSAELKSAMYIQCQASEDLKPGIFSTLLPLFIMFAPGPVFLILYFVITSKNKKGKKATVNALMQVSHELLAHYNTYENCPIEAEYSNPVILLQMKNLLRAGKAETIREALGILITPDIKENILQTKAIIYKVTGEEIFFCTSNLISGKKYE